MRHALLALLLLAFLLASCTTAGSRQKYVEEHPNMWFWKRDAILQGQVLAGMTIEEVTVILGKTFFKKDSSSYYYGIQYETWIYRVGSTYTFFDFENGVLTGWTKNY